MISKSNETQTANCPTRTFALSDFEPLPSLFWYFRTRFFVLPLPPVRAPNHPLLDTLSLHRLRRHESNPAIRNSTLKTSGKISRSIPRGGTLTSSSRVNEGLPWEDGVRRSLPEGKVGFVGLR